MEIDARVVDLSRIGFRKIPEGEACRKAFVFLHARDGTRHLSDKPT
jgi:hypothetical protein